MLYSYWFYLGSAVLFAVLSFSPLKCAVDLLSKICVQVCNYRVVKGRKFLLFLQPNKFSASPIPYISPFLSNFVPGMCCSLSLPLTESLSSFKKLLQNHLYRAGQLLICICGRGSFFIRIPSYNEVTDPGYKEKYFVSRHSVSRRV